MVLDLYHGSPNIIEKPVYGAGNPRNDYGLGFYCTRYNELAKEWSVSEKADGFSNHYRLDTEGLKILNLNSEEYHILNWLAILLENRQFRLNSDLLIDNKEYLLKEFLPSYKSYDIITGYRADDSYFSFANLFLNNGLTLARLRQVMKLGNLGEQYCIRTKKGFARLEYIDFQLGLSSEYYLKKKSRDDKAREAFRNIKSLSAHEKLSDTDVTGSDIYLMDIIRGRWKNDDSRLQ